MFAIGVLRIVRDPSSPRHSSFSVASGLSAPHRGKDLVDVQELIRHAALPPELADSLDASVRDEYRNRWQLAQASLRDDD